MEYYNHLIFLNFIQPCFQMEYYILKSFTLHLIYHFLIYLNIKDNMDHL